jgi:ABC-type transporter Mla subunit MlaD
MTTTTTQPTGEAASYEAAEAQLAGLAKVADDTKGTVETLTGSLAPALTNDAESLGKIMAIEDAADALAAAVTAARDTFTSRHEAMAEAVNSAPHAAPTEFYRG